jgi:hypothetical protein
MSESRRLVREAHVGSDFPSGSKLSPLNNSNLENLELLFAEMCLEIKI